MATINPRLLALVETLINGGADWLAVELIDTINSGRWPEESEEVLVATRSQVREAIVQERSRELERKPVEPVPIPLDAQMAWAAEFVADRIDAALNNLSGAFANLDAILGETSADTTLKDGAAGPLAVRVGTGDAIAELRLGDIEQARAGMLQLRFALRRWSLDGRAEFQT